MGFGYDLLAPGNVTKIVQQTQDILTLPAPLMWLNRAARPNASDDEMTMREKSYVYAADIISADSSALIRDSGDFKFDRHSNSKMKHGFAISESMMKTINRIEQGSFIPSDVLSLSNYVARRQRELIIGIEQRIETMINGMLCDGYNYERLGIKMSGSWGMPSDLKFNPVAVWSDHTDATPITDMINVLKYAARHYGEGWNRITMTYGALADMVASAEFKAIYRDHAFRYAPNSDQTTITQSGNPNFYLSFIAAFLGGAMTNASNQDGGSRQITIEIDEGQYREFSSASSIKATQKFHPESKVYFTNSADDLGGSGWDVGNGECVEAMLGKAGLGNIIGGDFGNAYGPVSYTTLADPNLNPPGMVMWATQWAAPRRFRDTCSGLLTIY